MAGRAVAPRSCAGEEERSGMSVPQPGEQQAANGVPPSAPWPWREHQVAVLEALAAARERGLERVWVSLPPGAGKTAVGLAHALASGRPVLVLVPNTAVRSVWLGEAARFGAAGRRLATTDATLPTDLTVLTYQALVGRADDENESAPARLSPAGERIIAEMARRGPFTIVLDECHHLLALWGELLAHMLDHVGRAEVIGLTATPPSRMSRAETEQMRAVIGEPVAQVPVPPLVARGELAPFVELAWLTRPTAAETDWLAGRATRTAEFITWLTDPSIASTGLLVWAELRWGALSRDWPTTSRTDPELADAVLRLAHAGHLSMPPQAGLGEAARAAPGLEDWLAITQDWWAHCLRRSGDPRDAATIERLRELLPGLDHRLGRHGITQGVPAVQRVLARSDAKARGAVEIVTATLAADPQARLLVLCDHAEAAALPADVTGTISEQSGSARRVAALLAADPRLMTANPLLVTGRRIAGSPEAAALLTETAAGHEDELGAERLDDGLVQVTGWGPSAWVRAATAMIESGTSRVLVGTRALLGEGWDAPSITGVVDLGSATTSTAVVQTRGRALRRDPARPDKVAVNWSVCAIAPGHPQGDGDWRRLVRKHDGWFAPDETGEIVDQVAHLDSRFSPYTPPPAELFDAANAAALARAERLGQIRQAWAGLDPNGFPRGELRITPAAGRHDSDRALAVAPDDRLAWDGHRLVVPGEPRSRPGLPGAAGAAALAVGGLLAALTGATPVALAAFGAAAALTGWRAVILGRRMHREPGLVDYAQTVLAALQAAGLVDAEAALDTEVTHDGELRFSLSGAGQGQAEVFVQALSELIGPVGADARYLINRWRLGPGACGPLAARGIVGSLAENWHAVPGALADSRAHADLFAAAWADHIGGGTAVYTGHAVGAGLLAAVRGTSPLGEDSALAPVRRTRW
ncbi:DEAD/DEAH box helicase [Propionibacterium australiense]|uniref:DEAD/DEAH box helicase n=2 Tax=Propionibacterium australiense TaxID=119981 RepID=A0A8B3FK27_9ACTN|nr:DEAD/DEAH box helicase [Propionibacterium australiense]